MFDLTQPRILPKRKGAGVDGQVRVVQAADKQSELLSLHQWLSREDELRGRVELDQPSPEPGQMGAVDDVLVVALGGSGAVTVLANSLRVWLTQRHADVVIEVSSPHGRRVTIDAKRVADPVQLIHEVLACPGDERGSR